MAKDQVIPRRNKMFWHYARNDFMFTTIRVISKHQDTQVYGAILPQYLTNQAMLESEAYMTYHAYATGEKTPKPKSTKRKADSESSSKTKPTQASKGKRIKTSAKGDKPAKKKQSGKMSKGLTVLSELSRSGSGADEGTGIKPGVPDVPTYKSDDEQISWESSDEEDDDDDDNDDDEDNDDDDNEHDEDNDDDEDEDDNQDDDDQEDDGQDDEDQDDVNEQTDSDNDGDNFVHPKLLNQDQVIRHNEEESDEESDEESQGTNVEEEELDEEETNNEDKVNELYRDVNSILKVNSRVLLCHLASFLTCSTLVQIQDQVKEQVKAQVSKILPKIKKTVNEQLEAEVLTRSYNESKTSHAIAANLSKLELKKILTDKMESNKSIHRSDAQKNLYKALVDAYKNEKLILDTYGETFSFKRHRDEEDKDEEPSAGSNRGSKRRRVGKEPESTSAPKEKTSKTTGKSTEGTHTSRVTEDQPDEETSQLPNWFQKPAKPPTPDRDWNKTLLDAHGPVQPWLSSLTQMEDPRESFNKIIDTPLDFLAFVMNRLKVDTLTPELLAGPTFELIKGSCKSLVELEYFFEEIYKATIDQLDWNNPEGQQYLHDLRKPLPLISNSRGRRVIPLDHFINHNLAYLSCGVSSRTYTTSVTKTKAADYRNIKWIKDLVLNTMESAQDVYSKRRIIAVTKLQIVEWHNYKHLDWITVCRDDDKLYTFKEGDFNRLRIQGIEDMLLLLVQGKLTNLTIEERLAFNVSLRISYLKRREAYTAYSNPRGFIHHNKDKKNRFICIDELYKFSDGTLNDVRTALDDHLKGIRMKYPPQTIWRQSDRDKVGAIIQAIDK
ncbi:hypothetical protein Tco_1233056 [Tanacetum coccineum]